MGCPSCDSSHRGIAWAHGTGQVYFSRKQKSFHMESSSNEQSSENRHRLESVVANRQEFLCTSCQKFKIYYPVLLRAIGRCQHTAAEALQVPDPKYKGIFCILGNNGNFLKLLLEVLEKQFFFAPASPAVQGEVFRTCAGWWVATTPCAVGPMAGSSKSTSLRKAMCLQLTQARVVPCATSF